MSRPVAIRAHAISCSLGQDTSTVAAQVFAGARGLSVPTAVPFTTMVGAVHDLPRAPELDPRYETRLTRLAACALRQIQPSLQRYDRARVALVLGSSTGGMHETELAYPALVAESPTPDYDHDHQHPLGAASFALAQWLGLGGPSFTVSTACSSSAKALGSARRLLHADLADAVIVCGVDTLCRLTLFGFHALGVLSASPTRPFSRARDGISLGEGAACVLLDRGDSALQLLGVGESSDAHHLSSPDPDGHGVRAAMQAALDDAGVHPDAIGHVNAHGTGTLQNDAVESKALFDLFQRAVPITSNKASFGHLLGASGLCEAVIALESLQSARIPPTLDFDGGDDTLRVDVVRETRAHPGGAVLSNSFGFGGSNVSIVVGAA